MIAPGTGQGDVRRRERRGEIMRIAPAEDQATLGTYEAVATLGRRFRRPMAGAVLVIVSGIALAGALLPDAAIRPLKTASVEAGATTTGSTAPESNAVPSAAAAFPAAPPPTDLRLAPEPAWALVRKPIFVFHLESAETDGMVLGQKVFTRGAGTRRDVLEWLPAPGLDQTKARSAIQIEIERFEAERPTYRPLFADLAARAASAGLSIGRMNPPGEIETKFGAMEVADAVLIDGDTRHACLVFRRNDAMGLTLAGWFCSSAARPANRVSLGCFVDRLDLVAAGQDRALKQQFALAERNRKACPSARHAGRKASWLDHEAPLPPLKLSQKKR
jgi:hypothetical protein